MKSFDSQSWTLLALAPNLPKRRALWSGFGGESPFLKGSCPMLGLSLPIVATATILVGQTATDAMPPTLAEVVQFEVQCSQHLIAPRYWPRYRYSPGQKQIILFTDRRRIGEVRHINLETMTYEVRWAEYVHETGVCKPVP